MAKPFICNLTKEELEKIYNQEDMTADKMKDILGCKSKGTVLKILHKNGINTARNKKLGYKKRGNRTDEEFAEYLVEEYVNKKRSMTSIAKELNISWIIVSRYLDKYKIPKRNKSEQQRGKGASNWQGGKHVASNGYIEIYMPYHPKKNKRGYIYEHQYMAEQMLGRPLTENEVVHHIDKNKRNNDPSNLLVLTKQEHSRLHIPDRLNGIKKRKKVVE